MYKMYAIAMVTFLFTNCDEPKKIEIDLSKAPEKPELFAENIVSTRLYERDMAIAPDGREFIYTLGDYKQRKRVLVSMQKEEDGWSDPTILNFSGVYNDIEPFYSPNGTKLFFASDRPLNPKDQSNDYNIWVAEKQNNSWVKPVALDTIINSTEDEFYPSVANSGNLYFTTSRPEAIGREDIFVSQYQDGKYQLPEPLDTNINSPLYEFNAFVSPDEQLIVFTSYARSDDLGGGDLYFSMKDESDTWSKATNLGPEINSAKLDYCPFIHFGTGGFYFTSERDEMPQDTFGSVSEFKLFSDEALNGLGNIYYMEAKTFSRMLW